MSTNAPGDKNSKVQPPLTIRIPGRRPGTQTQKPGTDGLGMPADRLVTPDLHSVQQKQSTDTTNSTEKKPKVETRADRDGDSGTSDIEIVHDPRLVGSNQNNHANRGPALKFIQVNPRKRKDPIDYALDPASSGDELDLIKPLSNGPPTSHECQRNDKSEDVCAFTVHLQVWSHSTTTEPKRIGKPAKTTTTTVSETKGPFGFDTSRSFNDFKSQVAATLACRKALLPVFKFQWKFEREPQAAPRKSDQDKLAKLEYRPGNRAVEAW